MVLTQFLKRLPRNAAFPPPDPDQPICAIGDIHGRLDLLERLLLKVPDDTQIVCVGDYIDRGEQSAQVLSYLQSRPDILCLKGNHEEMLLDFLDTPERCMKRWLTYGGLQTVASFGLRYAATDTSPDALRDMLLDHLGDTTLAWLRKMPRSYLSGNVLLTHAGADPDLPIQTQPDAALTWGHPNFLKQRRSDGNWVVFGHTIVDRPCAKAGRISVDTGAYATGRLTAAILHKKETMFIEAT